MQFTILFVAAFASLASAQATCFDAGDCILSGGGQCIKTGTGLAGILGKCAPKGATTLVTSAKATGTAAAGKGTCFDDGDCLLYAGTTCKRASNSFTG